MSAATAPPQETTPGRDRNGRFSRGNPKGPANPFAREVAQLRQALLRRVMPEKLEAIADKLIELALRAPSSDNLRQSRPKHRHQTGVTARSATGASTPAEVATARYRSPSGATVGYQKQIPPRTEPRRTALIPFAWPRPWRYYHRSAPSPNGGSTAGLPSLPIKLPSSAAAPRPLGRLV
jgi:hypothetical protein